MRGKQRQFRSCRHKGGITPADAGKTLGPEGYRLLFKDHPRGCGENARYEKKNYYELGSPPRMRGKRKTCHNTHFAERITPADAGKTETATTLSLNAEDHPRGCGENPLRRSAPRRARGSPPRMRGKPAATVKEKLQRGITPADAGKTPSLRTFQG